MSRPPLEVADIIRAAGDAFIERNRHWLGWKHVKVLLAIARCRTAALGGHLDQCTRCGHRAISFNSCRNRHCPKCQTAARERWIAARQRELLPTRYLHVVFTLPSRLAPLVLQNKKVIYDLLFRTSAETLLEVARNPEHLGAEIGAGFIEMCRKTVTKSVRMNAFLEAGALGGFLTCVPNGFRIDRPILPIVAGEQPGAGFAMVETPMGAECCE